MNRDGSSVTVSRSVTPAQSRYPTARNSDGFRKVSPEIASWTIPPGTAMPDLEK